MAPESTEAGAKEALHGIVHIFHSFDHEWFFWPEGDKPGDLTKKRLT